MSVYDGDISWEMLRRIVHEWLGTSAELSEVHPLHGGCINTTLSLATDSGERAVLKISNHRVDRSYLHEAYQLNVLRDIGIPAPQVYACKIGTLDEPFSYLLMEFVPGVNLAEAKRTCDAAQFDHLQAHLADVVLALHGQTASHYTRLVEGKREEFDSWPKFYRHVYDQIWRDTEKSGVLPVKLCKQLGKVHERLDVLLGHTDCPRLTHSDLWSTNIMARADEHGRWWVSAILDPNCKYAHAEMELAYLDLFRTVTPTFMRAYQSTHRLPNEYHNVRKHVYQLYSLYNHVRIFGQEYLKPLLAAAEKVTGLV